MASSFLNLATRGPSLFSNPNPKLAVLGVLRGQMANIRLPTLCKCGGNCIIKVALSFGFGHHGASLFCNRNSKLAVLAV